MAFPFDDGDEVYLGGEMGAGYSQINTDIDREIDAFYADSEPLITTRPLSPPSPPRSNENPIGPSTHSYEEQFTGLGENRYSSVLNRVRSRRKIGEVDPLDYYLKSDEHEERRKRKRAQEEAATAALERLTERLAHARDAKRRRHDDSTEDDRHGALIVKRGHVSTARLYKFPPMGDVKGDDDWTPISGTEECPSRLYVLIERDTVTARNAASVSTGGRRAGLSGVNFREILSAAEDILERQQDTASLVDSIATELATELSADAGIERTADRNNNVADLWVEKYRPRVYTDLLSDDGVNRNLLTWLKLWDHIVFGKKIIQKAPLLNPDASSGAAAVEVGGGWKKKQWQQNTAKRVPPPWMAEIDLKLDASKRPQFKIALLCGPPGLGKTTLAHVIARHCGYNVLEMNASDDRTVDSFKSRIEGGLTSARTVGANPKPNCLIVDEVDGAPVASIKYLVNLIQDGVSNKKRKVCIKRPIICICNDLYTPSLRELRKVALLITFPSTTVKRLSERLNNVCLRESVSAERQALEMLCEKTSHDIRACLNTLQFAAGGQKTATVNDRPPNRSDRRLTLADIQASASDKDDQRTLFQVWKMIFEMPRAKPFSRRVDDGSGMDDSLSQSARFGRMLSAALACGDYGKVSQGVFENYLSVKNRETTMDTVCLCFGIDWLVLDDVISVNILSNQNYGLMRYQPYVSVVFHLLFATMNYVNVLYPHQLMQLSQRVQRSTDTLELVLDASHSSVDSSVVVAGDRAASIRVFNQKLSLVADTLPFVVAVVQPKFRPVNSQLYSAKELAQLRATVEAMLSYNLNYVQQRNTEGQYMFTMQPPIDELVRYSLEENSANELSYSTRQLIHQEIELERVRRADGVRKLTQQPTSSPLTVKRVVPTVIPRAKVQSALASIFCKGQLPPTTSHITPAIAATSADSARFYDVWFKFNAGYSNAIRRNIRMKDLLS